MSKIAEVMREEITRLAKKEVTQQLRPVLKRMTEMRSRISQLQKECDALNKQLKRKVRAAATSAGAVESESQEDERTPTRLSPKLLKKLRKRLNISQTDLARLVGVSQPAVASWEQGRAKPRADARSAVIALRQMSPAEVAEKLGQ